MSDDRAIDVGASCLSALLVELARGPAAASGWSVPLIPGERCGRFEILREIGRGGFGIVYEARDLELGRRVALKTVRLEGTTEAAALAEAEAAARLAHPNIVTLHDVGRTDRGVFLILELLQGKTLAARLREGPVPAQEAARMLTAIAAALAHAHASGVVHRDLSPANVFVCDDGAVKVLDFGLARALGREGPAAGTQGFIAPEQQRGAPADTRSDVFALGALIAALFPREAGARRVSRWTGRGKRAHAIATALAEQFCKHDPALRPRDGSEAAHALRALSRQHERTSHAARWSAVAVSVSVLALVFAWSREGAPLRQGRLTFALAKAVNSTGHPSLENAEAMLAVALEGSSRFTVSAASERGKGPPDGRLILAVRPAGDEVAVELRVESVPRGELLFSAREVANGPPSVPDAIDRLADRFRKRVDDTTPASERPRIAAYVPDHPEALAAFLEGEQLVAERRGREADAAYRRALDIDPDFALAHARLATANQWTDRDAVAEHLARAEAGMGRLPPKERAWLEAQRAMTLFRSTEALERFERAQVVWPEDRRFVRGAADILQRHWSDIPGTQRYARRLLELGPASFAEEVWLLQLAGDFDAAVASAQRWAKEEPGPTASLALATAHRVAGHTEEARRQVRQLMATAPGPMNVTLFWTLVEAGELEALDALEARERARGREKARWYGLVLRGRMREALAVFDATRKPPADASETTRAGYHNQRADLFWASSDVAGLQREIRHQLELGFPAVACTGIQLASLGDLAGAERLAALWPHAEPRQRCSKLPLLLRAWRKGELDAAIAGLREMFDPEAQFHLGLALIDARREDEAVETFRALRRWPDRFAAMQPYVPALYAQSHVHEAIALERAGRHAEALEVLDRLDVLWRQADADLPALRLAWETRARVVATLSVQR